MNTHYNVRAIAWSLVFSCATMYAPATAGTHSILHNSSAILAPKTLILAQQDEINIKLRTSGVCGMCKTRIEKAAQGKGVLEASWDAGTQLLTLRLDTTKTSVEDVKKRVAGVGHDIDGLLANDEVYANLHSCCLYDRVQKTQQESKEDYKQESWDVSGACGMCKTRIEEHVQGEGLISATWDVATQKLAVEYNPKIFDTNAARGRILASGHDTNGERANQKAYENLPACCKYKDPNNPHNQEAAASRLVVGVVMQENDKGELKPVSGASILWEEATKIKSQSDKEGVFNIAFDDDYKTLVVSLVGQEPQKVKIEDPNNMIVIRFKGNTIAEVTVTGRRSSSFISGAGANRVETLTSQELFKAACCDLSESFETNASVDVVNSDAVTGSKQIQMLGLSGNYTQLTVENLPGPRGLATPLGLNSIAGTWIESIQISKGVGSVVNGFENMTGQINVELKKPESSESLFFNIYGNQMGRSDVNLNLAHRFNDKWSTGVLLHDNFMLNKHYNTSSNGFRDVPVGNVFSGINRWKYDNGQGFLAQFGIKFLKDDRIGGQVDFDPNTDKNGQNLYGIGYDIARFEVFGKFGYIFPAHRNRSIGLQISASQYDQDSYFGLRNYKADQQSSYANLIYQDIIGTTDHKIRTGLSSQMDRYNEVYVNDRYKRTEVVSGAFAEYTYTPSEKFDAVLGMRADYNSLYGWFGTPRLHMRYQPSPQSTFRISAGRGQRTANIFAENTAAMASSRIIRLQGNQNTAEAYGLKPEVTWNLGFSFDQNFKMFNHAASISAEFFRNDFSNQIVVDFENPRELAFYNLEGKSYANSFQTELRFVPYHRFEVRTAYRLFDVKTTYGNQLLEKPLVAKHRGFVNLGYQTAESAWSFDYTLNMVGQKRLPSTKENPSSYQLADYSKGYVTMNAQITKTIGFSRPFDVYLGGENLTNFFQKDPILAYDQPFGQYFDSSLLWGPLTGRMIYAGIRFSIQ